MTQDEPDPDMKVAVLATLDLQSAHLLAGRLDAEGIRCMVAPSGSGTGPWIALPNQSGPVSAYLPLGLAPLGGGNQPHDVLIDADDLEAAKEILAAYES